MKTATESKREINAEKNKELLSELAAQINTVDPNNKPSKIVKSIDKIIYDFYFKFYDTIGVKKQIDQQKNGHCC